MSGRRIKINLPNLERRSPAPSVSERPSSVNENLSHRPFSRTDRPSDNSFSSEMSPGKDSPRNKNFVSLKPGPSTNKLREILAQTSEKLSIYSGKPENSINLIEVAEKSKEITELKKTIKRLETDM
jgi:hypothetical protein